MQGQPFHLEASDCRFCGFKLLTRSELSVRKTQNYERLNKTVQNVLKSKYIQNVLRTSIHAQIVCIHVLIFSALNVFVNIDFQVCIMLKLIQISVRMCVKVDLT